MLLLVFTVGMLMSTYYFETNKTLYALGIVLSFTGFYVFFLYLRKLPPNNNYLIQLLKYDPQKIVWVYSIVTQRMPFGIAFNQSSLLYFKLIDGNEIVLSLSEKKIRAVMKELNAQLPHATFGYTRDREQWYLADPAMLYKD